MSGQNAQAEELDGVQGLEEPTETPAQETPPEGEEKKPEVPEGFVPVDQHQKDVNVQHKRFRDEERGRIKQKERADRLQAELDELKGTGKPVEIPPMPDRYDADFETKMAERDDAIRRAAEQDAQAEQTEAERKKNEEEQATAAQAEVQAKVETFDKNMIDAGLDPAATKKAADTVIEAGISVDFQDALLEDPDGPLFVQYLAQNPVELDSMSRMSSYQRFNHMNGLREKVQLLRPKTSNAPPPPTTLEGGGAPETKESWEEGAVYE